MVYTVHSKVTTLPSDYFHAATFKAVTESIHPLLRGTYYVLERQRDNFNRKLNRRKDTHHLNGKNSFVAVRQLVVERHDDAIGDDGDDDGPFENGPVDEPGGEPSHRAGRRKEKEVYLHEKQFSVRTGKEHG